MVTHLEVPVYDSHLMAIAHTLQNLLHAMTANENTRQKQRLHFLALLKSKVLLQISEILVLTVLHILKEAEHSS